MALNFMFLGVSDKSLCVNGQRNSSFSTLLEDLECRGIDSSLFHYVHDGSPIEDPMSQIDITPLENESNLVIIRSYPRLLGGKGGFGALIRAMGMRMNRNRNKDACRDLTGRRLRSVNAEKKVAELMKKEPEKRRKEAEEKANKRRLLLEGPRHQFNDQQYIDQLEATHDSFEDAFKQGLKAGSSSGGGGEGSGSSMGKRKSADCNGDGSKRMKLWMDPGSGESLDSDVTDSEEESERNSSRPVDAANLEIPTLPPVTVTTAITTPTSPPGITTTPDTTPPLPQDTSQQDDSTVHHAHSPDPPSASLDLLKDEDPAITTTTTPAFSYENFDLDSYSSVEELEAIGGEPLKVVLQKKGLKCGGTPHERAMRLWSIRGKELEDIDPTLLATKGKGRSRNKGNKKKS